MRLAKLPVVDAAADDYALFLWATDPLLPRALELINAWGFAYKTVAFYWVKLNSAAKHAGVSGPRGQVENHPAPHSDARKSAATCRNPTASRQ